MKEQLLGLFDNDYRTNPLTNRHVCLTGDFSTPTKQLYEQLISVGAKGKRKSKDNKDDDKESFRFDPTKYIHFFVVGNNPKDDAIKRVQLNAHDGFHAKVINEETLYKYLHGQFNDEDFVPETIEKKLNLDISYYNWSAPEIKDNNFVSRVSSPMQYDADGIMNPITQKEIYVQQISNINMDVFSQIIGNLGGYANKEYFEETNVVLLGDDTLKRLEKGIKDNIILDIENRYNKNNSKIFNVQFTSESDFINWAKCRMKIYPDENTINLIKIYDSSK